LDDAGLPRALTNIPAALEPDANIGKAGKGIEGVSGALFLGRGLLPDFAEKPF
jgi:hypothetical protein